MAKILSAKDLLDLVSERVEEENKETEVSDGGRAGGRRIYGARKAAQARSAGVRRTRNNTQIIEAQQISDARRAMRLEPALSAELDPPTPLLGQKLVPTGVHELDLATQEDALDHARTMELELPKERAPRSQPRPLSPPAKPQPPKPPVEAPKPPVGAPKPLAAPAAPKPPAAPEPPKPPAAPAAPKPPAAPAAPKPPAAPAAPKPPAAPEPPKPPAAPEPPKPPAAPEPPKPPAALEPTEPPAAPELAVAVGAKRKASSQAWERVVDPTSEAAAASGDSAAPESAAPDSPAPASAASMFSWVTAKPAWAPEPKPLAAPAPPKAPEPPAPVPIESFIVEALPGPEQSVIANEPIALTSEETLVLVNYDLGESLEAMADKTGLSEWRVERIVTHLRERGVLEAEDELDDSAPGSQAHEQHNQPSAVLPAGVVDALRDYVDDSPERDAHKTIVEMSLPVHPEQVQRDGAADEESDDSEHTVVDPSPETLGLEAVGPDAPAKKPIVHEVPMVGGPTPLGATPEPAPAEEESADEDSEEATTDADGKPIDPQQKKLSDEALAKSYLALFENELMKLSSDERAKLASTGTGKDLFALCFDKDPQVTRALWQNISVSIEHARFATFHHRTTLGLEIIGQRTEFLKDNQVQRRLFRNPSVSEPLLRKMLLPKRLLEIYKATTDREAAERTRQCARGLLRNKFSSTEPEDRMDLIWRTEGRALVALSGMSIDSKTAALICARPLASLMIVQSFSRFAATPPSVIGHFLKQNLVRRQLHLRNALLKHPNCPTDAKRAF